MPVILYRDTNFEGPAVRLQPGFHSGYRALEGTVRGATNGEDLSREVSSIRVEDRYVAVLYGGLSDSASSGARTLVGPTEIPDLGAVGMDDKTASVQVYLYSPYLAAVPRDFGVKLYSSTNLMGMKTELGQGDYNRARLESDEVNMRSPVQSLCVGNNTLVILYSGGSFESTEDSVAIAGPRCIADVDSIGMYGDNITPKIRSVRILYTAVADTNAPSISRGLSAGERATRTLGTASLPLRNPGSAYNIPVTALDDAMSAAGQKVDRQRRQQLQQQRQQLRQQQLQRQQQLRRQQLSRQQQQQVTDEVAKTLAKRQSASNAHMYTLLLMMLLVVLAMAIATYRALKVARRGSVPRARAQAQV